ncbi:DUF6528 family protein [Bacillus sp. SD088]|uniref:DUF6528 family protein n=1 Tax=Bacillus sp. SD088 TaxID=2782012 RepID=UPI001A97B8DD|nr:DUF6528 family protein [Bacillus sp. SD088]MBO0991825.1 hypothetical protein [Bacillus sp. SD088]
MKKFVILTLFIGLLTLMVSCQRKTVAESSKETDDQWIAVTDQKSQQILVFDPAKEGMEEKEVWDKQDAEWTWSPTDENGFAGLLDGWGHPSDVTLREIDGEQYMAVTDSYGFVGIVPYPAGDQRTWGLNIGLSPHAAEILPDGNIAVALSSSPGSIRIYTSSEGADSEEFAEYLLPGAHGVVWDPEKELLWALGTNFLVALEIKGTSSDPRIEEVHREQTPTSGGHNLSVVYGDTDKLWVTTVTNVYQYSKSKKAWITDYPGVDDINKENVKSIGNQLSGQVVLTQQKESVGENKFTTDTIDFYLPTNPKEIKDAEMYKARIWSTSYQ